MHSTNGYGSKRAILYARVSTEEQARTGFSLAQQIEALRDYATREGYENQRRLRTLAKAGRAWSGRGWTVCETWCRAEASRWCWHRTGTVSLASPLTTTF